jgi:hypothetical protein
MLRGCPSAPTGDAGGARANGPRTGSTAQTKQTFQHANRILSAKGLCASSSPLRNLRVGYRTAALELKIMHRNILPLADCYRKYVFR